MIHYICDRVSYRISSSSLRSSILEHDSSSNILEATYTTSRDHVCDHPYLRFATSRHADGVGYHRPTAQQRAKAAGKKKSEGLDLGISFPAPLVLPEDDLSFFDPTAPPQSLLSWVREKARNEVTPERKVLYIAGPPEAAAKVSFVRRWSIPQQVGNVQHVNLTQPAVKDVMGYLAAFYHGMRIKLLPPGGLHFAKWGNGKSKARSGFIGLNTTSESIGIRVRPSPGGVFRGQLSLDDLLDTAIGILPHDAYALLMLVEQDLFEDEDDDFCCGRAYGGSRVAVVSMARYNSNLDERQNVERQHAWPASHCEAYMRACCGQPESARKASKKTDVQESDANNSPLHAAVAANNTTLSKRSPRDPGLLSDRWLSRVCQTASHELGHCFGIDHCVYYACVMQSTSSLAEDVRQPPYLCPVDLAKVLRATGADEMERYTALRAFCKDSDVPMFAAFESWLGARLAELDGRSDVVQGKSSSVAKLGSEHMPIEFSLQVKDLVQRSSAVCRLHSRSHSSTATFLSFYQACFFIVLLARTTRYGTQGSEERAVRDLSWYRNSSCQSLILNERKSLVEAQTQQRRWERNAELMASKLILDPVVWKHLSLLKDMHVAVGEVND